MGRGGGDGVCRSLAPLGQRARPAADCSLMLCSCALARERLLLAKAGDLTEPRPAAPPAFCPAPLPVLSLLSQMSVLQPGFSSVHLLIVSVVLTHIVVSPVLPQDSTS